MCMTTNLMLDGASIKEMDMKLFAAMFIATLSMPLASLAGVCSFEFGFVSGIRQALGIGVVVGAVALLLAIVLFLCGIPATLQRLRAQSRASN
jgi:hypothetical protein